MTKRRFKTCKGREGCIHLSIFLQAEKEELIENMGSLRLKEKEAAEKKTEIKSNVITGKKFKVVQNKNDLKSSKEKKVLSPEGLKPMFLGRSSTIRQQRKKRIKTIK